MTGEELLRRLQELGPDDLRKPVRGLWSEAEYEVDELRVHADALEVDGDGRSW